MIPERYKQTEKGIIPEDWALHNFGEKVTVLRGGSPRPITAYLTKSNEGINWIKIGDVKPGEKYINSTEEKIIPEGASRSRVVHKGDFILSNSMSFGRPYILNIDGCIHDGWLTIQNYSETFNKNYLYYVLSSTEVFKQYVTMAAGSSVQNLNKDKVSKLLVVAPEVIREQEKIAEALSDTDDLISSLEKLIEKKKAIKQGAMQNLLTGKIRLPGFSKQLENHYFKSFNFKIQKGQTITKSQLKEGRFPVVAGGRKPAYYCDIYNRDGKTITISASGASAGFVNIYSGKIFASDCSTISESKDYDITYIYYLLLNQQEKIYSSQTGGAQPHIHPKDINNLKVFYTRDIKEQKSISEILSDMDKEIERLEQKLAKARLIKQGMMQQLLTGKIRLV